MQIMSRQPFNTRFIVVAEMLLLGLFARPRTVADVQKPNAYGRLR